MNNIIYAGCDQAKTESLAAGRKYWQIILCETSGTLSFGKATANYAEKDIAVIPPLTLARTDCGSLTVFMELTTLPFKNPAVVKDDENRGIAHALGQAAHYYKKGSRTVLDALGGLIAGYIAEQTSTARSPVVELVIADINANVSNSSYALDAYMHTLPLNYDYVRKLFKSEVGVTPHDYLTAARMELAGLIISGGMSNAYSRYSVGQIAEMCGYAEPLYFSRVFKKYYGVAPSEYKNRIDPAICRN